MHHDVAVRRGIDFAALPIDSSIGAKRDEFHKHACCLVASLPTNKIGEDRMAQTKSRSSRGQLVQGDQNTH